MVSNPKNKPDFPDSTWEIDRMLLTTEQKAWMLRTDRSRAFKKFVVPASREHFKRRRENPILKKQPPITLPESLSGIDVLTKKLLLTISDKMNDANVLDLAKTIDILSDVKAKALKDSLSLQAANYTPTVITQDEPKVQNEQVKQEEVVLTDKPEIFNNESVDIEKSPI